MRSLLLSLLFLASLPAEEFKARITYYIDTKTASGIKPVEGKTVAAEKRFKMGTKFEIPALKSLNGSGGFVKQDVGPAIERRTASRGKYPVIDVYVSQKSKIKEYSKKYPAVVTVKVLK
jgi:3D (Asp-Asp-Asp) domain-containing protein